MEHIVIYKKDGIYAAFPQLDHMADGRLAVGFSLSLARDHNVCGEWAVLASEDNGLTWSETDDPTLPLNWPGDSPREKSDRFADVTRDGTYLCAGTTGWETWPPDRRREAEQQGLIVSPHRWDGESILVRKLRLCVQHSKDKGMTWTRREWDVHGFQHLISFSRPAVLADGTILVPVYGTDTAGAAHTYVWRSSEGATGWRLAPMPQPAGLKANETAVVEVSPGRVLAHARNASGYLCQMWSDDGGRTWSVPLLTDIWAPHSPPHLLKLRDGRILCTYGYRRRPMGIRAVLSGDGGETWDTENTVILRDDGGTPTQLSPPPDKDTLEDLRLPGDAFRAEVARVVQGASYPPERARPDLGYPLSTQLADGTILTVYYITLADGVTHVAATRWDV